MSTIPAVSLKGVPVPVERTAEFAPHRAVSDGVRTNTPAAIEARAVLARKTVATRRTAL